MRGQTGAKVVSLREPKSRKSQKLTVKFGNSPWNPLGMVSDNPYDNWLRYQAQSVLGGNLPTLEEAQRLFVDIDPSTRMPRLPPEDSTWWQRICPKLGQQ
ncbi:MAG: hypothetical protein DDT31_01676 [Syntrophomonadaceae bacterium]|nr:hypothetical protein [Bacillota bacterium]